MIWRHWTLLAFLLAIVVCAFFVPRIAQDPAYHNFADQRRLLGVPNFFDVISNVFFLFVGAAGIRFVLTTPLSPRSPFSDSVDRWSYLVFFVAVGATAIGSGYYHMHTNNETLVWDRLPMAVGFLALLAAVLCERLAPPEAVARSFYLFRFSVPPPSSTGKLPNEAAMGTCASMPWRSSARSWRFCFC